MAEKVPEYSFVTEDALDERLDAGFYSERFLKNINMLLNSFITVLPLSKCIKKMSSPIGWAGIPAADYLQRGEGYPMLRVQNIGQGYIEWDGVIGVQSYIYHQQKSVQAESQDVILTRVGTIGRVAVVPEWVDKVVMGQNQTRLTVNTEKIDQHFLSAFLMTSNGQLQMERLAYGGVQASLTNEHISKILLPLPNIKVQRVIGNKMRKAERLREIAENQWQIAIKTVESALGINITEDQFSNFSPSEVSVDNYHCTSVWPGIAWVGNDLLETEMGAQYHIPRRVRSRQIVSQNTKAKPLYQLAERITKTFSKIDSYVGLDQIQSENGTIMNSGGYGVVTGSCFEDGDILFSRLRPYLNKVSICPKHIGKASGSGELLVYQTKGEIDPYYLFFMLRNPICLYQVIDVTTGSTHPRVDSELVDNILIPIIDENEKIAGWVQTAHQYWYESSEQILNAILKIESLIEGTLDEEKLLAESAEIEQWLNDNPSPYAVPANGR
ncbi:MAG: restriction endonuclease subunit S [Deltaproteobacteria bacterium]